MQVDFNNLRRQAVYACERLIDKLNGEIKVDEDTGRKRIEIDADDIEEYVNELRDYIGSIAMCYDNENPEMRNVFEELFPEDKGRVMLVFNPEEEPATSQQ